MTRIVAFILALCCLAAAPAPIELWQCTFNSLEPNAPQLPPPSAPWQPAFWTMGALDANSTPLDVRRLAELCRDGGELKKALSAKTLAYLRANNRLDSFPGGIVPRHTLLIADYEGASDAYAVMLCTNARRQTQRLVQYPGFLHDDGINFPWTSRLGEVDFYCISRMWLNGNHSALRQQLGDYFLIELYLFQNGDQDAQFRAWSILLNAARRQMPGVKILGLVKGSYAYPGTGLMADDERRRLARFIPFFDGVIAFGYLNEAAPIMADIASLTTDPLAHLGAGWAK